MVRSFLFLLALCFVGQQVFAQTEDGRCEYCIDKECGPNGIGGTCGTCPVGQSCHRGQCTCVRNCDGRECGDDGCGTLCGECLTGQVCQNGICVGDCTPQCVRPDGSLRTCGWDRCGRNDRCGSCPEGCEWRCRDGTCECYPDCENKHCGDDGCGGSCGTCEGDNAFCQGPNDPFPGQCYVDCFLEMRVEVRESATNNLVLDSCTVAITGPLAFSRPNEMYPGSVPGFFTVEITEGKFGDYSFTTTCAGYVAPDFEVHTVSSNGQLVTIIVEWLDVLIEVRDEDTQQLLPNADIAISATGYSLQVAWFSPSYVWSHGGFMMYTFTTSSAGYTTRTVTEQVSTSTTLITLFLGKGSISIIIEECPTNVRVNSGTVVVDGQTINVNGAGSFIPSSGFIPYSFSTSSPGYLDNTQTISVTETTTQVTVCVNLPPVEIIVTDCSSGDLLNGAQVAISNTFYSFSTSVVHSPGSTFFTPVGYEAQYQFDTTFAGYESGSSIQNIQVSTSEVRLCLVQSEFCGNGFCAGDETADPLNPGRCEDCGRLRGVISLAVGQKDQLVNITVNVWAHPVNPALFMRRGEAVPAPHFSTLSDSKGFFSIQTLSFLDAAQGGVVSGGLSRRFYFSLSGRFTDRTSGNDVVVELLPLWWNYELVNVQWFGSGSLVGTNNSPSLYFYMTPPFTTDDAIIRIILSWGTLISNPSSSLPDLDMVVAGPVDDQSLVTFGNGIVNFENKDLHAATDNVLPFAKIITDSAQGFGPEVVDFQGNPNDAELFNLGWSDSYAPDAPAQAYEIWIDRPNSAPNQDSAFTFIFDTNSFIVIYRNDGTENHQLLFDDITNVEWAYGFYNGDEWNQIPDQATMWHIIDFSRTVGDVVFDGFPGETNPADTSEAPGAKYAFNAGFFEATKQIPCGHVAARGANPAYCPATLNYPQKK